MIPRNVSILLANLYLTTVTGNIKCLPTLSQQYTYHVYLQSASFSLWPHIHFSRSPLWVCTLISFNIHINLVSELSSLNISTKLVSCLFHFKTTFAAVTTNNARCTVRLIYFIIIIIIITMYRVFSFSIK